MVSNWCMQLSKNVILTIFSNCRRLQSNLQSALDIDYTKKDLIIDVLMLISCMNVRAYCAMNIVLCRMFFYNMLKFPSDTQ